MSMRAPPPSRSTWAAVTTGGAFRATVTAVTYGSYLLPVIRRRLSNMGSAFRRAARSLTHAAVRIARRAGAVLREARPAAQPRADAQNEDHDMPVASPVSMTRSSTVCTSCATRRTTVWATIRGLILPKPWQSRVPSGPGPRTILMQHFAGLRKFLWVRPIGERLSVCAKIANFCGQPARPLARILENSCG